MKTLFPSLPTPALLAALIITLGPALPFLARAAAPSWWQQRGVLDAAQPQNDYAAVNIGQLKHIAKQAMLELDAKLPGGAGTAIQQMVASWSTVTPDRNDFAAVNVGQLKAVAKPFYERLNEAGYQQSYPWSNSITNRNDFAQANVGQLKVAFAICVSCPSAEDADNDGVPDWWETQFFGSLSAVSNNSDHDSDGLSDFWEYVFYTNPMSRDTDGDGLPDGHEVVTLSALGFSPTNAHTKNPTTTDSDWAAAQDSDADGMNDRYEVAHNLNHLDPSDALIDQDGDTLTALQEFNVGSDPWNNDTDYDGLLDQEDGVASAMSNDPFNGQYDWRQDVGADGRTSVYGYAISHYNFGDGWVHSQTEINGLGILPPPAPIDAVAVVEIPFGNTFWSPRLRTAYFHYPGNGVNDPPFTYQGRLVISRIVADTETGDGNPKWGIGPPYDETNPDAEPAPPSPKDLNPVKLYSDLNNDGTLNSADIELTRIPYSNGTTNELRDKGTEFMFANDSLSNGVWDKEDEGKPSDADDDDAEPIIVGIGSLPKQTEVWLEHPASSGLKFYRNKKCTEEIHLSSSQRHIVGGATAWPTDNKVYVRAESVTFLSTTNPQVEGDLKLMIKPTGGAAAGNEGAKMKLTIIKDIGATKYFHGARDYMLEQNARLHVRFFNAGSHQIRITAMRHESTDMGVIETYHRNPKIYGMPDVVAKNQDHYDLILNGNFCFFDGGSAGRFWGIANHQMTPRCHGGCVAGGAQNAATSVGGTNPFEQPNAEYLSANGKGTFAIATGVVPLTPPAHQAALGGFASNLVGGTYNTHPWFGLAEMGSATDKKKLIFTVTQTAATTQYPVADLAARLTASGQTLCVAGDGGSSSAIAHRIEGDSTQVKFAGGKHYPGHYWINTYVGFKSDKPRP